MSFKNWNEYLDERGKVVGKAKQEEVPDYSGPDPKAPAKAKTPKPLDKDGGPPKPAGSPSPYRPANSSAGAKKGEKGFGDEGKKDLVYKPGAGGDDKKVVTWPQTKTESFLQKTRDMSASEFATYMVRECGCDTGGDEEIPMVTAYAAGKFHPHPPEALRYVVSLAVKNPRVMENLIHELKSQGGLKQLLSAALDHPESYDGITELMGDEGEGPGRAGALARSMNNHHAKFLDDQEEMYEAVAPPYGGGEQDEHPHAEDDHETPPEGDQDGDEAGGDEGGHPDDSEGGDPVDKPKKLRKKFPHHHMIDAMASYPHMADHMAEKLGGGERI